MYATKDTKFVDLTTRTHIATPDGHVRRLYNIIACYINIDGEVEIVTNKWGTGYESFAKARQFLRSRRYGFGNKQSMDNTIYVFNADNQAYQAGLIQLIKGAQWTEK